MNSQSSRSHSVLQIKIGMTQSTCEGLSVTRFSNLTFVDLAGSERQRDTLAKGQTLTEAKKINLSLSSLSLVIAKLS